MLFCKLAGGSIGAFLRYITCLIAQSVIPLIFALALAGFVWGVVQFFIIGANEESKREQGKKFIFWGLFVLAAMASVWGLVRVLGNTFRVNTSVLPGVRPPGPGGTDPIDDPGNIDDIIDSPIPCRGRDCPPVNI